MKSLIFLVITGGFISLGITLSFYSAQLSIEDLTIDERVMGPGETFEIMMELDPSKSENGGFAVKLEDFEEASFSAKIFDPLNIEIQSMEINQNPFQEKFDIISKGTYTLVIENSGQKETNGIGAIGYYPEENIQYMALAGNVVIMIGLVGMIGVGIYIVKNRRNEKFS